MKVLIKKTFNSHGYNLLNYYHYLLLIKNQKYSFILYY